MAEIEVNRLTMREAGAYLNHSYSWIAANHRSIGLNGYRIGGRWFFDLEELREWEFIQKNKTAQFRNSNSITNWKKGLVTFA